MMINFSNIKEDEIYLYFKINKSLKDYKDNYSKYYFDIISSNNYNEIKNDDKNILKLVIDKKYIEITMIEKSINIMNKSISYELYKFNNDNDSINDILGLYIKDVLLSTREINSLNFIFNKNNRKEDNDVIIDIFKESSLSELIDGIYIV